MGKVQNILLIGAIVISSLLGYATNTSILTSTDMKITTEQYSDAVTLSEELFAEINSKAYDENIIGLKYKADKCMFSDYLRPKIGEERYPNFDDVDDYNYYHRTVSLPSGNYHLRVKVNYYDPKKRKETRTKQYTKEIHISVFMLENTTVQHRGKTYQRLKRKYKLKENKYYISY